MLRLNIGADMNFIEIANYRCAFEEENAPDQLFGVTHFPNGALFGYFVQLIETPVSAHFGMDHVLIYCSQFVRK
jgi:hypothetical protein